SLRAKLSLRALGNGFPGISRVLEELAVAAIDDCLFSRIRADGDRGVLAAGAGDVDILIVSAAAQIQRVPGNQSDQGMGDGFPGTVLVAKVLVVAAGGIHEARWTWGKLSFCRSRCWPKRRMRTNGFLTLNGRHKHPEDKCGLDKSAEKVGVHSN